MTTESLSASEKSASAKSSHGEKLPTDTTAIANSQPSVENVGITESTVQHTEENEQKKEIHHMESVAPNNEKENYLHLLSEVDAKRSVLKKDEARMKGQEEFLAEWEANLKKKESELTKLQAKLSRVQKTQEEYQEKLAQLETDRLSLAEDQKRLQAELKKLPELEKRESILEEQLAEQKKIDADYTEKKKQLSEDFKSERISFDKSLEDEKKTRLSALDSKLSSIEKKAREDHEKAENDWNAAFIKRKTDSEKALTETLDEHQKNFNESIRQKTAELDSRQKKLDSDLQRLAADEAHYAELERNAESVQRDMRRNEHEKQRLDDREAKIEIEVSSKANKLFEQMKRTYDEERKKNSEWIEMLRSERDQAQASLQELRRIFDRAQSDNRLNGRDENDLVEFYSSLKAVVTRYDSIHEQTEDTSSQIPEEIRKLQERVQTYEEERETLINDLNEARNQAHADLLLQGEIERLNGLIADKEKTINAWKAERELRERESQQEIKCRISDIRRPAKDLVKKINERGRQEFVVLNELKWLESIRWKMFQYKTPFSKKILYAFHTALKTGEWSPITVLAGISGTGKSLLPKLYADFGGLNFLSVPVQPTWDSSDALLGFFNSLTGKFEAQPLLKFLAQTQLWNPLYYQYKDELKVDQTSPNGLQDSMSIVLLDEMNLAHIELYFADFLSKLEERRSAGTENLPCLEIPITGNETYSLALGRNVLWVGTMNQDETTKSLSDKVLDRGAIIDFPRPHTFKSRTELHPQTGIFKPEKLLGSDTWASWTPSYNDTGLPFEEKDIEKYKTLVENINERMAAAGRAIGHRVWQSMEMYMANYPLVLAHTEEHSEAWKNALQTAFEDQLIQKVMPKLRGIETTGKIKTECLIPIQQLLDGNVSEEFMEDFRDSCSDRNYGQFIWSSAHYYAERPEDLDVDENMPDPVVDKDRMHSYQEVRYIDPDSIELQAEQSKESEKKDVPKEIMDASSSQNRIIEKQTEELTHKQPVASTPPVSTPVPKDDVSSEDNSNSPKTKVEDKKKAANSDGDPKVKMFEFLLKHSFSTEEAEELWSVYHGLDAMKADKGKSVRAIQLKCFSKIPLRAKIAQIKECIELI